MPAATTDAVSFGESSAAPVIRPGLDSDLPAIAALYAWHVQNGTGTFELAPPDVAEMTRRHAEVVSKQLPWLVAVQGSELLGFAYANHFKPRAAYRFMVEDSIYLQPQRQRQGIGRALLAELLGCCEARGVRQVMALIGDSGNLGSIGLHRACGFDPVGVMASVGWKFGQWRDVVLMQRSLGWGHRTDPVAAP